MFFKCYIMLIKVRPPWKWELQLLCYGQEWQRTFEIYIRNFMISITTRHLKLHSNHNIPKYLWLPLRQFCRFFRLGASQYLVVGDRLSGWTSIFHTPCGSVCASLNCVIQCQRNFFSVLMCHVNYLVTTVQNLSLRKFCRQIFDNICLKSRRRQDFAL